jgi:hypothetical protein
MAGSGKLYLYETESCTRFAEVESQGLDVFFPHSVHGWSEVLDCRIAPYDSQSLEENCEYAEHVRKLYILVTESQVAQSTPPTTRDDED